MLNFATSELSHSKEDVVNYIVCHNTRKAISNFLNSYLLDHNQPEMNVPVSTLMSRCRAIDGRFSEIDLSPLECQGYTVNQNDCYCYDLEHIEECLNLARQVEGLVAEEAEA